MPAHCTGGRAQALQRKAARWQGGGGLQPVSQAPPRKRRAEEARAHLLRVLPLSAASRAPASAKLPASCCSRCRRPGEAKGIRKATELLVCGRAAAASGAARAERAAVGERRASLLRCVQGAPDAPPAALGRDGHRGCPPVGARLRRQLRPSARRGRSPRKAVCVMRACAACARARAGGVLPTLVRVRHAAVRKGSAISTRARALCSARVRLLELALLLEQREEKRVQLGRIQRLVLLLSRRLRALAQVAAREGGQLDDLALPAACGSERVCR